MPGEIPPVAQDRGATLHGLSFVVDPPDVQTPVLRSVLDYWKEKRQERPLPRRSDIDPLELKPYLRQLFLIDVLPGAEFRYRLIGSEITERYGRNSTGKTVHEVYAAIPEIARWLTTMLLAVVGAARPVLAVGPLTAIGKAHIFSESLHLPLADSSGGVGTIFGAARYTRLSPR
ncbi:MAG TPA: PAS domain-containing protein [Stellaceae bacterium]|jgi:hypothetical protein|nr:PAS domain-containing protein [Stellaceae bacterium]